MQGKGEGRGWCESRVFCSTTPSDVCLKNIIHMCIIYIIYIQISIFSSDYYSKVRNGTQVNWNGVLFKDTGSVALCHNCPNFPCDFGQIAPLSLPQFSHL